MDGVWVMARFLEQPQVVIPIRWFPHGNRQPGQPPALR